MVSNPSGGAELFFSSPQAHRHEMATAATISTVRENRFMVHQSRNFFVDGVPGFYPHGGAGAKRDHAKALSRKEFNSPVRRALASWRLCVIDWSKNQSKKTISEEKGRDTASTLVDAAFCRVSSAVSPGKRAKCEAVATMPEILVLPDLPGRSAITSLPVCATRPLAYC